MKSILQTEKECYVCKRTDVHEHHIFFGSANRKQSEKYGLKIWLCPPHHNMSDRGIHFDHRFDKAVKQIAQAKFEETHSREEFIQIFGKSWL